MVDVNIINYKDIVNELKPHYPNLNDYEIALGCFYKVDLRDYYIEDISEFCNELKFTLSGRKQISDEDLYNAVIDNIDYSANRELSIPNTTLRNKIAKSEELMINVISMGNGKYVLYLFVSKPKFLRRLIKKFMFWKI